MLQVRDLCASYGATPVLRGVNLQVSPGEIVVLLGRNGSGRSTIAKSLMGIVRASGSVQWEGVSLLGLATHDIARLGVGYVPEARDVFPGLTVEQNLMLGCRPNGLWPSLGLFGLERVAFEVMRSAAYERFPALARRAQTLAGVLSGGEQQMLTLARTGMGKPRLWVIDEPTEGLAPKVVGVVADFLCHLRAHGAAVLLTEQKLQLANALADRCLLLGRGRVVFDGTPAQLLSNASVRAEWLEF